MKKENIWIPKPNSAFLNVECAKCKANNIVYSHTTRDIHCKSCDELLAERTGGRAQLKGAVTATLD